jgi:hypothetical protein
MQVPILIAFFAPFIMPTPLDTNALIADATCIQQCIPEKMQNAVLISILAKIAGVSTDPASLMAGVNCVDQCIPDGMKPSVIISLLEQIEQIAEV